MRQNAMCFVIPERGQFFLASQIRNPVGLGMILKKQRRLNHKRDYEILFCFP